MNTNAERKNHRGILLRIAAAAVALTLLLSAAACAAAGGRLPDPPETEKRGYNDGVIGGHGAGYNGLAGDGVWELEDAPLPSAPSADYSVDGKAAAADGHGYIEIPEIIGRVDGKAGTLSAGEWKDAVHFAEWQSLLAGEAWSRFVSERRFDPRSAVLVTVKDGEAPCFNVPVRLMAGDTAVYEGRTDVTGRVLLFFSEQDGTPDRISAGSTEVSVDWHEGPQDGLREITVDAKDAGIAVTQLDLLLMIDTTGSMGDELEYIKAELYDVVQRVAATNESLSIRCSVNFYRDEGDEYVVKYFDFRTDINECVEQIKQQYSAGGGDYPEAVHTALDNAVNGHQWRNEAVKLCVLVLDAPPHSEAEIQGINAQLLSTVKTAAAQGIRIIPLASSGVDGETEYLLRSFAVMTGGTYLFLTNDSGIGFDHKEPEIGEHTVEFLNDCMVRVISEYCGTYTGEPVPYTPPHVQQQ